jgi:hypothetical protein
LAAAASLGPPATLIVGEVAAIPQQAAAFSGVTAPAINR